MQMAMVLTLQKPIQRKRVGELPEGLPGSTVERGMRGEKRQELGRPHGFLVTGRPTKRKADGPWGVGSPHSTQRAGEPTTGGRG